MAFDPNNFKFSGIIKDIKKLQDDYDQKIKPAYDNAAEKVVESFKDFSDYTIHVDGTLFSQHNVLKESFSKFTDLTTKTYNDFSNYIVKIIGSNSSTHDDGDGNA